MIVYAILLYNFCIVAGTAYLIALHDWSMWTWLLTFCFFLNIVETKDNNENGRRTNRD